MEWMTVAQDRGQLLVLDNTLIEFRVPKVQGIS
jgi:hypothetical protein